MKLFHETKPLLEDLFHFGVKGMKWGVRKKPISDVQRRRAELASVNNKIDRIDANRAYEGYQLRGWAAQKQAKKIRRKNPNFQSSKLSPEQKRFYEDKASKKAVRSLVIRGTAEAALIIGGTALLAGRANISPKAAQGAKVSATMLGGKIGLARVSQIQSVRTASKLDRLRARRKELEQK